MASRSRRSGWIIVSALVVCVLATIGVVLWIWLPRWAPKWVVKNSPWFEPAYRAALNDEVHFSVSELVSRIDEQWQTQALATFAAELHESDSNRRKQVVGIIGCWLVDHSSNPAPLAMLVRFMQHDPDPDVRESAIEAVPDFQRAEISSVLIGLTTDPVARIRMVACYRLGKVGDPAVINALLTALRDPNREVMRFACLSLGKSGDARAVEHLFPLLAGSDQETAQVAWEALCSLPRNAAQTARLSLMPVATILEWKPDELECFDQQALSWGVDGVAGLVHGLKSDDAAIRLLAARGLAVVFAGEPLTEPEDPRQKGAVFLRHPWQHDMRNRLEEAVVRQGVELQVALLTASVDANAQIRCLAFIALRGSRTEAVRAAAVNALDDQDPDVTIEAALTLAAAQDQRAYPLLMERLDGGGTNQRASAGLGMIGDQRAIEPLAEILGRYIAWEHAVPETAWALGEIGDLRAIAPLIHALNGIPYRTNDEATFTAVVQSLSKLGDWRAVPVLIEQLSLGKPVISALVRLGDPRAITALNDVANDPAFSMKIRRAAVSALDQLRHPRSIDVLLALADSPDHPLARHAAALLADRGERRAADRLIDLLAGPDDDDGFLSTLVDGLSRMSLTTDQRARLCSPSRDPQPVTSSAAPATPGSTAPPP